MGIFTILWIMLKQIIKNWKLELTLLVGLTLAVAVFSSIPIYSDGSLQMTLMEYWEGRSSAQRPPGVVSIANEQWRDYHPVFSDDQWRDQRDAFNEFQDLNSFFKREIPARYGTDLRYFSKMGRLDRRRIEPVDPDEIRAQRYGDLAFLTGIEDNVEIIEGRWYDPEAGVEDDRIEVVIDAAARDYLDIMVGRTYRYPLIVDDDEERRYLEMEIVGAFRVPDEKYHAPVWLTRPPFEQTFFTSLDTFSELVVRDDTEPRQYDWYWVFDHEEVRVHELPQLLRDFRFIETRAARISDNVRFRRTPVDVLRTIAPQADLLEMLLLILSLPVMAMILYYVVLTAGMTIRRRSNEIAMLKSRGAGTLQIMISYALEWGILCLIALGAGPYIGLMIARVMGASAGFLSFVGRSPLPVILTDEAYRYALFAIGVTLASCLLLVIPATRHSIVTYKQNIARGSGKPVWQRYYLDLIFVGLSFYGYRALQQQIEAMQRGAGAETEMILDPLLFLVPVLFLATAGLLALRILPWIVKIIHILTEKLPDVCWVMTLRQFARDPGRYSPLMFFIILTVSLGIYGASLARTLDQNFIDSLMYEHGADVVLQERWSTGGGMGAGGGMEDMDYEPAEAEIAEPPFYVHKELPGVKEAARVQRNSVSLRIGGSSAGSGTLMGIDPKDFAHVTWFRDDLVPGHLHHHLNRLIRHYEGALVNREFFEDNQLELGDWVSVRMGEQEIDFYVVGVIDLWPTVYPSDFPLLVANLDYIQAQYVIQPYSVWLNLEEGAQLGPIVERLREEGIWVVNIDDSRTELVEGRRDPQRMGLFGMLTISFITSVVITVIGFFLYTFLSLRNRILQFGVLRAIGLSVTQLIAMLSLEQLFSVGIALGLGTVFGIYASRMFLPFMQVTQDIAGVVPDFLVVIDMSDILRIFAVLGGTLLLGLIGLGIALSRMRLHEAIKLGEEV